VTNSEAIPLIAGDFYEGVHGPTILLEAQSLLGIDWFHQKLQELSRDERASFDLASMPEVRIAGIQELRVETVAVQPEAALTRMGGSSYDHACFSWKQDSLRWIHASMLIEPLLRGGRGHQYLTSEAEDAALVEFSFGEDLGVA
jgi:hypothetical protein